MSYKQQEGKLSSGEWVLMNSTTECQVTLLAAGVSSVGGWGDTMVIVSVNHLLKEWEVQSGFRGDMMYRSGGGNGEWSWKTIYLWLGNKKCVKSFLDNISAGIFTAPGICCSDTSKVAAKKT